VSTAWEPGLYPPSMVEICKVRFAARDGEFNVAISPDALRQLAAPEHVLRSLIFDAVEKFHTRRHDEQKKENAMRRALCDLYELALRADHAAAVKILDRMNGREPVRGPSPEEIARIASALGIKDPK
jgi:hypothetical protein